VLDDAARASSARLLRQQKPDLQRQVDYLVGFQVTGGHRLFAYTSDARDFSQFWTGVTLGAVSEVVVAHRDRLARIAFRSWSTSSTVQDQFSRLKICRATAAPPSSRRLMAILTHFTAKHNGRRSYRDKERSGSTSEAQKELRGSARARTGSCGTGQGIRGRAGGSR
jgi:predicted site-specific integrase-resolvase